MTEQKHIIWSSDPDYEDWRGDLEEQYPELSEQERMELMQEKNALSWWRCLTVPCSLPACG